MAIYRANYATGDNSKNGTNWTTDCCKAINRITQLASPGDTCLVALSPDGASGMTASWPAASASLPDRRMVSVDSFSGKATIITDCLSSSGWVASGSGDVTLSYQTTHVKYGTNGKLRLTFDSSPQANTLQAYCPIGGGSGIDLSAYQDVECWVSCSAGSMPANSLVIKLCSDANGASPVDTLTFGEASAGTNLFPLCLQKGSALGSAIRSIAIYTGSTAPAASSAWNFDCFYATNCHTTGYLGICKLIHKPFPARWQASTAYTSETIMPTFAYGSNRIYQCVSAGTSGTTEPDWDMAYHDNDTISDGTCIWKCVGYNEAMSLWPVKSIDVPNLKIEIDNHVGNVGNNGRGHWGTEESTELWCITPFKTIMVSGSQAQSTSNNGNNTARITIRGGADTDDTIKGITVFDGRNGAAWGLAVDHTYLEIRNIWFCRYQSGYRASTSPFAVNLRLIGFCASNSYAISVNTSDNISWCNYNYLICNNGGDGFIAYVLQCCRIICLVSCGQANSSQAANVNIGIADKSFIDHIISATSRLYGYIVNGNHVVHNLICANNNSASIYAAQNAGICRFVKPLLYDSTEYASANRSSTVYMLNVDEVSGNNKIVLSTCGYAIYDADNKQWTAYITSTNATSQMPERVHIGAIYCDQPSETYQISVKVNPSNSAIKGRLVLPAQSFPNIKYDITAESSGSGEQTLTLNVIAGSAGLASIYLDIYVTSGTTYNIKWNENDISCKRGSYLTTVISGIFNQAMPFTIARPDTSISPKYPVFASPLISGGY